MAVAIATKVDALRIDFGSAARLADMLGVSRAQVTRWLRGSGIDPLNAEKVDLLELVWSNLLRLYEREAALAWLFGLNPRAGRPSADRPDPGGTHRGADARDPRRALRLVRVILHRCLAWNERAAPDAPDGALWFPRPYQGEGRHDNPAVYGCLYLSEQPLSCVVEQLARFRGQRLQPAAAPPARPAARARGARAPRRRASSSTSTSPAVLAPRAAAAVARRDPRAGDHAAAGARPLREARRGRRAALVVDLRVAVAERDAIRPRRVRAAARLGESARRSTTRRSPRPPTSSAYASPEPTRSGKYGGARRKPMRASGPRWPRAIWSAAPMPPIGTKPSWRTAVASRAPAT